MQTHRRSLLKNLMAIVAGATGIGLSTKALGKAVPEKQAANISYEQDVPLFIQSLATWYLLQEKGHISLAILLPTQIMY
jgi:hypothetical protein